MQTEEENWIKSQREYAREYLHEQGVEHLGIGEYPAFHIYPYLALWAVQSKRSPGWIGWWTITGDLPADYISSSDGRHPREALSAFAQHWHELSNYMLRGETHPKYKIGTQDSWPKLGDLLQHRAKIIQRYADDDEIWASSEA